MDKNRSETSFILDLMRNVATIFILSILAISLVGLLLNFYAPDGQDISSLFDSGGIGLPYSVIFQVAGFSFILALFSIIIISDRFIKKMRVWLRIILLFISAITIFSAFAVIFRWFPVNDPLAWLGFFISTFVCFVFSLGLTFIKFRIERKKYNTLLEKYKRTHNNSV